MYPKLITIEGNIAAGKSTLLEAIKTDPIFHIIDEPVAQ